MIQGDSEVAAAVSSPRNHWHVFAQAMDRLAVGEARGAWRLLQSIRESEMVGPEALAEARALVAHALARQNNLLADLPADFLRAQPGKPLLRSFARFDGSNSVPRNFPTDMILPSLVGSGNDFRFITETAKIAGSYGSLPRGRLRLVFHLRAGSDVQDLSLHLAKARVALQRLPSVDLVVFCPASGHGHEIGWPTTWATDEAWKQVYADQIRLLAKGVDLIAFLPVEALADPLLLERALRYNALNEGLCMALVPLAEAEGVVGDGHVPTVLNEARHGADWQRDRYAYRRLNQPNFLIPAKLFSSIGGFTPRFRSTEFAVRELAFRAYNAGAFFMPLAVRADWPRSERDEAAFDEDKSLFVQLCPHPWDRKDEGRFDVPKVSIYIPAFRAARYLGDAIDSVLNQDFPDLEVCVVDDGSPDDTLKVLQSYSGDPRVRWTTSLNGGIGHASNRALRMTRGLYIGQLDSDDRLKPGAVRRLVEFLDRNSDIGCVYGSCERIDAVGNWLQKEYSHPKFSREKMMLTSIAHHFRMFRRQVWMRTEGFREDIANAVDYDMFLKMAEVTGFEHLDEVLYQRRWHGQNTSIVNESFQTRNTYVAQRHSLERQGIDGIWDVHLVDPEKPRDVTYRRKGRGERVFFWPDYSRVNPYQRLLYASVPRAVDFIGTDPDALIGLLRAETGQENATTVFHLHWLNKVFDGSTNVGQAVDAARAFLDKLSFMKISGTRVVWTIHNIIAHDTAFARVEVELARRIIELADCVHVHCAASLPEIERHYQIPREKLRVARHGAYVGAYPDFVTRHQARHELAINSDDEVMLFLGQIRPYKGMIDLLETFHALLQERPRLRLVLAGGSSQPMAPMLEKLGIGEAERARLTVVTRFLDDNELQLFFRAADFAVFPYRNILTSGSLLLALSFGVPVLIPDYAMPAQVLMDGKAGITYARSGGQTALRGAVRRMLQRLDDGQGYAMAQAARARGLAETWEDIYPILFGDTHL